MEQEPAEFVFSWVWYSVVEDVDSRFTIETFFNYHRSLRVLVSLTLRLRIIRRRIYTILGLYNPAVVSREKCEMTLGLFADIFYHIEGRKLSAITLRAGTSEQHIFCYVAAALCDSESKLCHELRQNDIVTWMWTTPPVRLVNLIKVIGAWLSLYGCMRRATTDDSIKMTTSPWYCSQTSTLCVGCWLVSPQSPTTSSSSSRLSQICTLMYKSIICVFQVTSPSFRGFVDARKMDFDQSQWIFKFFFMFLCILQGNLEISVKHTE